MKKLVLLAALLLPVMAYAQRDIPFTSSKPFNKGNFKIDASYSQLMQKIPYSGYPDFRVGIGYGITNWCVVGVFGSFGTHESLMKIGGGTMYNGTDTIYEPLLFDGKMIERYYHYGIDAELHPLTLLLPNFYFVDVYCRGELGMRTVTEQYKPDYDGPSAEPVRNSFLYGGSVGLAINPSKYFGVFYELAFDNLNKEYKPKIGEIKAKAFHRFGLNVRFPGPKKWQKQQ
jgi:hypothetical protein